MEQSDGIEAVTIGRVVFDGDTDKELFEKYLVATVTTMADMDGVLLPYEFVEKLRKRGQLRVSETAPDTFTGPWQHQVRDTGRRGSATQHYEDGRCADADRARLIWNP